MSSPPLIGVVVVNYFGGERTIGCLEAVLRSSWPTDRLRVVLVDNGSDAGFEGDLARRVPGVEVVRSDRNLGLAGAANVGIDALRDVDLVALLNNDALPDVGWLEPLVDTLERHPKAGAATPKVLLDRRFVVVGLRSPTVRQGGGDPRPLGVQLCGARIGGVDVTESLELVHGFWGWEVDAITVGGPFTWTAGLATFLVPIPAIDDGGPPVLELRLARGVGDATVEIDVDGQRVRCEVGEVPEWVAIGVVVETSDVINNAGLVLHADGSASDRGYLEVDGAAFDEEAEVFGWSGAVVLLRRRYLDDVGRPDPRYFLYYEDVDLSWRGRLRGWETWYAPTSIVRHERSATIGRRSDLAQHLADRNRLLVLTKCAPPALLAAALRRELAELGRAVARDVVRRALSGRHPSTAFTTSKLRMLGGYASRLPWAIPERRRVRGGATVSDAVALRQVIAVDVERTLDANRSRR